MTVPLDVVAKERGYSALTSALDMGYCLLQIEYDDVGRPVDYRFIDTNPLFELHTGLHDAIGRSALELVPDLEGFWIERYAQVAESGKSSRFVQRSRAMNRDFEVHAFPVGPEQDRMVGLLFKDLKESRTRSVAKRIACFSRK
ncbi:hypothetical protein [Cognatilysobacter bugurensis]|uniref:PAS domain-containing protein n=1 Tax=Cognatilysobacter bugurensis TaxID=543356 RepID=A0A918T2C5_9GAMM|nr:hypothetical protein [Lysobacter bugurensis]GHA86587.1 hypothetical protein GCM10007067_25800 [Lysobacter bugurensis]